MSVFVSFHATVSFGFSRLAIATNRERKSSESYRTQFSHNYSICICNLICYISNALNSGSDYDHLVFFRIFFSLYSKSFTHFHEIIFSSREDFVSFRKISIFFRTNFCREFCCTRVKQTNTDYLSFGDLCRARESVNKRLQKRKSSNTWQSFDFDKMSNFRGTYARIRTSYSNNNSSRNEQT